MTRHADLSFFKTERAISQLRKAEKAQTVTTVARLRGSNLRVQGSVSRFGEFSKSLGEFQPSLVFRRVFPRV